MKALLIFFLLLIPLIAISGCATQVQEVTTEETMKPQVTEGMVASVQPKMGEKVEIVVTPVIEPEETREPRIFHVNVVQGIGVKEGFG